MYCNKENVNILTAMLIAHGIREAVVCPGSRNAPIVHNLAACGAIRCHAVTDERSAGFYAIGLAQASVLSDGATEMRPVAVCVTSGSALLNLAPAVAEAYYQHIPIVVVSADRPPQWIDQLDGQTLPQEGVFGRMVRRCVSLPEPLDDEQRWYCRRLINDALLHTRWHGRGPVHINVPISEPLFRFDTASLPDVHPITRHQISSADTSSAEVCREAFARAARPMIVIGQTLAGAVQSDVLRHLTERHAVISEPLGWDHALHADEMLRGVKDDTALSPDLIIYAGGTIVSKATRQFLRHTKARTLLLTSDMSVIADPTMHLTEVVPCPSAESLLHILQTLCDTTPGEYSERWHQALTHADRLSEEFVPRYSQMAVAKYFEQQLDDLDTPIHVHYANSSAIRLACIYAMHHVWCNRGVNGIEGSLSTAAGFSLGTDDMVVCVIGDLSFFYDQNALWNASLRGNLRIILLNNGGGSIFRNLPGLGVSEVAKTFVSGAHHTEAHGICEQNDIGYLRASNMTEMQIGITTLLTRQARRPMVLEVITDGDEDARVMKEYLSLFTNITINQ